MENKEKIIKELFKLDKPKMKKQLTMMIDLIMKVYTENGEACLNRKDKGVNEEYGDVICFVYDKDTLLSVYAFEDFDTRRWYVLKNRHRVAVSDIVDEYMATVTAFVQDDTEESNIIAPVFVQAGN